MDGTCFITQLNAAPGSLNFGNVTVGLTGTLSGTITASGGSVTVSSATVTGNGYSLHGLTFPLTLTAGQSMPFTVVFAPTNAGSPSGHIIFVSDASTSATPVSLSGPGAIPTPRKTFDHQPHALTHLPP